MSTAYFLMNVRLNHEIEVIQEIKKTLENNIMLDYEIQGIHGVYDIILKITTKNDDELKHILLQKIKPINHIQYAMTMMVI
jgi:DNA-binding Lrp family transcriptional regulator|tara:strand:- start:119 stop:361 length:243 start_codon:yes stop_codon:yes gene_type:complete